MLTFFGCFSLAYIATTLGVTGLYHLARQSAFRETLGRHGFVPEPLVALVAWAVVGSEVLLATGALVGLQAVEADPLAGYVAASVAAALGSVFILYLTRLLNSSSQGLGCGCSPFAGDMTSLSLAPAAGVVLASLLGLLGMAAGGSASARYAYGELGGLGLLAAGWGVTLGILLLLSPEALRVDARRDTSWTA
jgi:hypothetical protein